MPRIFKLDQDVANLIAAGEVVSGPSSVVKELVENSIDAGSTSVTVEISSGGMSYIRVTDNGTGIESDDILTAFLPHATGKIRNEADLAAIKTLGFRGEALAAIAAVSHVEIKSRTPDTDEGVVLTLKAGVPSKPLPAGIPQGTTIIVRDLFFNTPARLKFMKSERAEGSAVSAVLLRIALSRPDISFRYIKDGKEAFLTPGDCIPDSCIYNLLGRELQSGFIPVTYKSSDCTISGFISLPGVSRGNRNYQFFFINNRTIRSLMLQSALEKAYSSMLTAGRFPACVLYIETPPENVDVNVHPAKTEVRFLHESNMFSAVYHMVLDALQAGVQINFPEKSESSDLLYTPQTQQLPLSNITHYEKPLHSTSAPVYTNTPLGDFGSARVSQYKMQYNQQSAGPNTPAELDFHIIGEALNTYIIAQSGQSVFFIDKHATHERLHYDAFLSADYTPMSESLLTPIICPVGSEPAHLLLEHAQMLDKLGFTVDSFGDDTLAVRHIPSYLKQDDVEAVLTEICTELETGNITESGTIDKIYKLLACKAAIKAGSTTEQQELELLARQVLSGSITHCPHGRPVCFELSKNALEKSFSRT